MARAFRKHADSAASQIRQTIISSSPRLWRYSDFAELNSPAVAKTFSRLASEGIIQRAGKGLYYRPQSTSFGPSKPAATEVSEASARHRLFPANLTAANLLGFTTQNPAKPSYATSGPAKPTKLKGARVYTRRPANREALSTEDAALLEFIRARGKWSELSPLDTAERLVQMLQSRERFARLARAAAAEPPRVRAILGAIGQQASQPNAILAELHAELNPLSRFDFGSLIVLKHANEWQAK